MTSFRQFQDRCKMRHDFDDQIQVRYIHPNGEQIDTWVSGEEALSRVRSSENEARLRALSQLDLDTLRKLKNELPEKGKKQLWESIMEQLADSVDDAIGDSIIGESLADAVRGYDDDEGPDIQRWKLLLHDPDFKAMVLELAWIQLDGSLPEEDVSQKLDDWV